jgi:hypothetical protein
MRPVWMRRTIPFPIALFPPDSPGMADAEAVANRLLCKPFCNVETTLYLVHIIEQCR